MRWLFFIKRTRWKKNIVLSIFVIVLQNNILCRGFFFKNPLRNVIVSRAVVSSIVENLSSELFDNSVILQQVSCFDLNHPYFAFYLAGFLVYKLYFEHVPGFTPLKITNQNDTKTTPFYRDSKLVDFTYYAVSRRITRQIIFVLLFLLTKNVENVY